MVPFSIDQTHQIVSELKRLAGELGRAPRRDELEDLKCAFSKHSILSVFGTYTEALKAAGLDKKSVRDQKRQKLKTLFAADIKDAPRIKPESIKVESGPKKIMVMGDTHFPFQCDSTLTAFFQRMDEFKPDVVIQIGDLYDMLAHSKFPRSLNQYNPKQEMDMGRSCAEQFWRATKSIVPNAQCFQILGNHCVRPMKRIIESYPEGENFVAPAFREFFRFDGVETIHDIRQELIIDGIVFIHGYMSSLGQHRDFNLMNVVAGHSHQAGVVYRNTPRGILFEANAGYAGDPTSKALGYTPQRLTRWTKSFLEIEKIFDVWQPRVIIP